MTRVMRGMICALAVCCMPSLAKAQAAQDTARNEGAEPADATSNDAAADNSAAGDAATDNSAEDDATANNGDPAAEKQSAEDAAAEEKLNAEEAQAARDRAIFAPVAEPEEKTKKAHPRQKDYPFLFPLFGRVLAKKGIELPLPWGVGLNYMYIHQQVKIPSIQLSANDNPLQDADFIGFKNVRSQVHTLTVRPDLWILPFLNVYGIFGGAAAQTDVQVNEPISFESIVNQGAVTKGFGLTAIVMLWGVFVSVDGNFSWTKLEKVLDPVPGRVLGVRIGKNLKLGKERSFTFWGGGMYQGVTAGTKGKIKLSEVMGSDTIDKIDSGAQMACDNSSRPLSCNALLNQIREREPFETTVNYNLDKQLKTPLNLILGAQYGFSKAWQARMEVGLIGRYSLLASVNYRFGIRVR